MKVLGLISAPTDPSSRVRILQYHSWFESAGIDLRCRYFHPLKESDPPSWSKRLKKLTGISEWRSSDWIKSAGRVPLLFEQRSFDIVWQNRLIQVKHYFWEKKIRKPIIFDFDDAIWINEGEDEVKRKIAASNMIFAGNEYLAEYASRFNQSVHVVPTTIDTRELYPLSLEKTKFRIGWIGTRSNFQYLETVTPYLRSFIEKNQDASFVLMSDDWPAFLPPVSENWIFEKWSAEAERRFINSCSVGIMPLTDTEWTQGKCAYKLLQYLACGIPVIASPFGVNEKILNLGMVGLAARVEKEWIAAFELLKNRPEVAGQMGLAGRKLVEEKYSCEMWTPIIIEHMKSIT
jgi:glycosyltransferase involved in cell wall biosynthesis